MATAACIEEGRLALDVRLENSLWHHPSSVFVTFGNFGLAFGFGSLTSREGLVGDGWKKRHWGPFRQHPLRKKWQALRVFMFRFSVFVVGWGGTILYSSTYRSIFFHFLGPPYRAIAATLVVHHTITVLVALDTRSCDDTNAQCRARQCGACVPQSPANK